MLLPGVAEFNEEILDKYEAAEIKLLRNRVTTLRLWLQLWDSCRPVISSGSSSGESHHVDRVFLSPKQAVALEQITKRLLVPHDPRWFAQKSKPETELILDH